MPKRPSTTIAARSAIWNAPSARTKRTGAPMRKVGARGERADRTRKFPEAGADAPAESSLGEPEEEAEPTDAIAADVARAHRSVNRRSRRRALKAK